MAFLFNTIVSILLCFILLAGSCLLPYGDVNGD